MPRILEERLVEPSNIAAPKSKQDESSDEDDRGEYAYAKVAYADPKKLDEPSKAIEAKPSLKKSMKQRPKGKSDRAEDEGYMKYNYVQQRRPSMRATSMNVDYMKQSSMPSSHMQPTQKGALRRWHLRWVCWIAFVLIASVSVIFAVGGGVLIRRLQSLADTLTANLSRTGPCK